MATTTHSTVQTALVALLLARLEDPDVDLRVEGDDQARAVLLDAALSFAAETVLEFACDGDRDKAVALMRRQSAEAAAAEALEEAVRAMADQLGEVGS